MRKRISNNLFICNVKNVRLDQYLTDIFPDISRSRIQKQIKHGNVTVNNISVKSSYLLQIDDEIFCNFEEFDELNNLYPQKIPLDILYEDKDIIVLNKKSGLVVHPGAGNFSNTLLNGLLYYSKDLSYYNSFRPGIVHRLDKDTSGILIIAKNDTIHDILSNLFSSRKINKIYYALVWGKLDGCGEVKNYIIRDPKNRKLFTTNLSMGRFSITKYKLISYYEPFSLVKLYPKTGRTHQLRVHMKSIGHPIFCDINYGGGLSNSQSFHIKYNKKINFLYKKLSRLALHAYSIEFKYPRSDKTTCYTCDMPKDMISAIDFLKNEN